MSLNLGLKHTTPIFFIFLTYNSSTITNATINDKNNNRLTSALTETNLIFKSKNFIIFKKKDKKIVESEGFKKDEEETVENFDDAFKDLKTDGKVKKRLLIFLVLFLISFIIWIIRWLKYNVKNVKLLADGVIIEKLATLPSIKHNILGMTLYRLMFSKRDPLVENYLMFIKKHFLPCPFNKPEDFKKILQISHDAYHVIREKNYVALFNLFAKTKICLENPEFLEIVRKESSYKIKPIFLEDDYSHLKDLIFFFIKLFSNLDKTFFRNFGQLLKHSKELNILNTLDSVLEQFCEFFTKATTKLCIEQAYFIFFGLFIIKFTFFWVKYIMGIDANFVPSLFFLIMSQSTYALYKFIPYYDKIGSRLLKSSLKRLLKKWAYLNDFDYDKFFTKTASFKLTPVTINKSTQDGINFFKEEASLLPPYFLKSIELIFLDLLNISLEKLLNLFFLKDAFKTKIKNYVLKRYNYKHKFNELLEIEKNSWFLNLILYVKIVIADSISKNLYKQFNKNIKRFPYSNLFKETVSTKMWFKLLKEKNISEDFAKKLLFLIVPAEKGTFFSTTKTINALKSFSKTINVDLSTTILALLSGYLKNKNAVDFQTFFQNYVTDNSKKLPAIDYHLLGIAVYYNNMKEIEPNHLEPLKFRLNVENAKILNELIFNGLWASLNLDLSIDKQNSHFNLTTFEEIAFFNTLTAQNDLQTSLDQHKLEAAFKHYRSLKTEDLKPIAKNLALESIINIILTLCNEAKEKRETKILDLASIFTNTNKVTNITESMKDEHFLKKNSSIISAIFYYISSVKYSDTVAYIEFIFKLFNVPFLDVIFNSAFYKLF